ncbi:MAG TPA: metalloregulator ArsR/SmtB family transcription factor [Candidatus Limnocylindria bacterium]|nr:metalloregulator ArsR/SmtB family transcription factor [Candidatus Limnocylindria bacterium]
MTGGPIDPKAVKTAEENMLSRDAEARARQILESLCDPTRLKIVRALRDTPLAASDIARVINRSRAATSQHLKVLRDVKAVVPSRQGNVVRYSLSDHVTAAILDDIGRSFDRLEASA